MPSTAKPPSARRAELPRQSDYAKSFGKDWERLNRSARFDMNRLREVMLMLIARESIGVEWQDHPLQGDWADHRECHAGGDFLLVYRLEGDKVIFVRCGTHAELFRR